MSYNIKELSRRGALLAIAVMLGFAPEVVAQTGSCTSPTGEAFLDVNNVRARILNNGNLFWRGSPHVYEVPKGGGAQAIFVSGVWFAGLVDGNLRAAAARYGNYELWTGPLDDNGNPPSDCSIYDKVWKVNRADVVAFEGGASAPPDMASWPTGLGAPTLAPAEGDGIDNDEDGDIDEAGEMRSITAEVLQLPLSQRISRVVDLAGGERPEITGDQTLWWIMNDRGNTHNETETPPIGIEVHATAFAFNQAGDIGNTTFYKYNVFYRGDVPLEDAFMGIFSDPDLGNFDDDYVGSDSTLGLGYVYNADDDDEGSGGYGPAPPAAGYDFFQGPIVPSVGDTATVSGRTVPDFRNLPMTYFAFYNNAGGPFGDPGIGSDYYGYMSGRWKNGQRWTYGDTGSTEGLPETNFMFPTDPTTGEFWSEFNADGNGNANPPADRRFAMSTGPFTINPNDQQEIVFGLVWARGTDNLNSVTKMFAADRRAQAAFDANFKLPTPPDAPQVTVTALDRQVAIEWTNSAVSNNFLDSYREFNPLGDPDQPFYEFEGYEVVQYSSLQDQTGEVIATFDLANGITTIIDDVDEDGLTEITTNGNDGGLQHAHVIGGLTNYQTYYFGVRSYAYNQGSIPKAFYSPPTRFEVVPAKSSAVLSDASIEAAANRNEPDITAVKTGIGDGSVTVDIVNPGAIRNCEYRVEFYELAGKAGAREVAVTEEEKQAVDAQFADELANAAGKSAAGEITYDVFCGTEKVFDGSASGSAAPQRANVFVVDGLEFSVQGPETGFKNFLAVQNAAGAIDPPDYAAFAFNGWGYPHPTTGDRPTSAQQTNGSTWGFTAGGGAEGPFATWISRVARGSNFDFISIFDYEMRFTAAGGLAYRRFEDGAVVNVPFELWRTGVSTPDDPSDDVRLVPGMCEVACITGDSLAYTETGRAVLNYDIGGDHGASGGVNDPYTDWIYWGEPETLTPGQTGYDNFFAGTEGWNHEVMARTVLMNWNGGAFPGPFDADLPEEGTVFRIETNKPNQPGDIHSFSTAGLDAASASLEVQQERLEDIGIVPNPYKGASSYEVSQLTDEVRFTNLPDVATIRVFSLNGTLLKTLEKNSPGNRSITWDLVTDNLLPLASGMYLIHVDVPGVGEHVMKFGVVKKRIQLNTF